MTPTAFAEIFSAGPILFVFAEIVAAFPFPVPVPAIWTGDGAGGLTV